MKTQTDKTQEPQQETVQRVQQEHSTGGEATIADNRPAIAVQRKLRSGIDSSDNTKTPIQRKNNTGLPDNLKSGIENLSGYSMDDVKVHYNSSKPAQLQAHAYAQGTDIHLAPGQEKHLPHEAWHVVQQKQGRVKPTRQLKSKVNINDDARLEKEADVMGAKALQSKGNYDYKTTQLQTGNVSNSNPIQRFPLPILWWVKRKLRKNGFRFRDQDVTIAGGNSTSITFTEIQLRVGIFKRIDMENLTLDIYGASTRDMIASGVNAASNKMFNTNMMREGSADVVRQVDVNIDLVRSNTMRLGKANVSFEATDIEIQGALINKIPAILSGLKDYAKSYIPERIRPVANNEGEGFSDKILNILGPNTQIQVGNMDLTIHNNSEIERFGRGGYTGEEGRLMTKKSIEGTIGIEGLNIGVQSAPSQGAVFAVNIDADRINTDLKTRKIVSKGKLVRKWKHEMLSTQLENLQIQHTINSDDLNLNSIEITLGRLTLKNFKGSKGDISTNDLLLEMNNRGNGALNTTIKLALLLPPLNTTAEISLPIRMGLISREDIEEEISTKIPKIKKFLRFIKKGAKGIGKEILQEPNPNEIRLLLEIMKPELLEDRDVLRTKNGNIGGEQQEIITAIDLITLLDYHINARLRSALGG